MVASCDALVAGSSRIGGNLIVAVPGLLRTYVTPTRVYVIAVIGAPQGFDILQSDTCRAYFLMIRHCSFHGSELEVKAQYISRTSGDFFLEAKSS